MATSALEANTEYYDDKAVHFYKNPAFKRDLMLLTKLYVLDFGFDACKSSF